MQKKIYLRKKSTGLITRKSGGLKVMLNMFICRQCEEVVNLSRYNVAVPLRLDRRRVWRKRVVMHCNRCGYNVVQRLGGRRA
ncbi:hypothetical protein ACFL54_09930 [Planctomycetota bacterium]